MTAAPLEWPPQLPRRPLTVAEYVELGETEFRVELVEGRMTVAAQPELRHLRAGRRLANALEASWPGWEVYQEADVNLELVAADEPGFVRIPDVSVASAEGVRRVEREGGILRASEVLLVIEIISPSSNRTDRKVKRAEYAEAGIPHYWILDFTDPISLLVCHQTGELCYADSGEFTGTVSLTDPFPFEVNLADLVR